MKTSLWLLCAGLFLGCEIQGAPAAKLQGMAFYGGEYTAFLEIQSTSARSWPQYLSLKPGQREGTLEVIAFDPKTGQLKIRENGQDRVMDWTPGQATLHFENAPVVQALDLFGQWQKKSWAAASSVLGVRITLHSEATDSMETALDLIKKTCRDQGVILTEAGEKLILAGKTPQEELMTALAESFPKSSPDAAEAKALAKAGNMVPLINFDNMPLGQVLDFYSELVGRTVLRGSSLPITTFISIRGGPLTKAEAIAALDAVMALNGFKTIPVGEKFVFVTTQGQVESVRPIADKLAQALKKGDTANTPANSENKVPLINFDNMLLAQVCEFYASLAERRMNKETEMPLTFISLKSNKPLTKAEALAALDAALALNGVELVPDGETDLKLIIKMSRYLREPKKP